MKEVLKELGILYQRLGEDLNPKDKSNLENVINSLEEHIPPPELFEFHMKMSQFYINYDDFDNAQRHFGNGVHVYQNKFSEKNIREELIIRTLSNHILRLKHNIFSKIRYEAALHAEKYLN